MTTRQWHDNHYNRTHRDTSPQHWKTFNDTDPFNPGNRLEGYIKLRGDDQYGALDIREVNGRPAPQFLTVTPKTSYPFFKDGTWVLQDVSDVQAYLKIDGTNVCQFCYQDADGNPYTSFKVRIRPFMAPFFINLLERCFNKYPGVRDRKLDPGEALMYELYGHDNPMLIRYPQDIDLALIFGREPDGRIVTLGEQDHPLFQGIDCPRAPSRRIDLDGDIRQEYERRQEVLTSELVRVTDDQFDGEEGEMLYVTFPDGARSEPGTFTRLIKLKAHQVEEIHWASDHITRKELEAVGRNVFELSDEPTEQDMIQLLAEDWTTAQIANSTETLLRVLESAKTHRGWQQRVLEAYHANHAPGDFRQDAPSVMRTMSQHFSKSEMSKVYTALVERGLADPAQSPAKNSKEGKAT